MEHIFYPTGPTTGGRTIVCFCCEETPFLESDMEACDQEKAIKEWLDENDYCVEKWQMDKKMNEYGHSEYTLTEMEGGAPAGGGAFATLNTVNGMGPVVPPNSGGTNADFYNGSVGSGDKFTTLTAGTPAAKRRKKRVINDFDSFLKAMKQIKGKK